MRPRVLVLLVAITVLVQGVGCCRCCRCFTPRESRLPPQELPRADRITPADRIPPAALPAAQPGEPKLTGAYGGS